MKWSWASACAVQPLFGPCPFSWRDRVLEHYSGRHSSYTDHQLLDSSRPTEKSPVPLRTLVLTACLMRWDIENIALDRLPMTRLGLKRFINIFYQSISFIFFLLLSWYQVCQCYANREILLLITWTSSDVTLPTNLLFSDFALVLVLCFVFFGWFTPDKPTDPNDPGSSPDQPSIGKSLMKLLRQDPELDFCLITRIANKFWSQMLGPRIPLKAPVQSPNSQTGRGCLNFTI